MKYREFYRTSGGEVLCGCPPGEVERVRAASEATIDYLNTDDFGTPAPYDDSRIREAVGVLLGYGQFQEQ